MGVCRKSPRTHFGTPVYMGGIHLEGLSILWSILKYLSIVVLFVLIRNTNPRVRIDQAVKFFWGPVTLIALIGFVLAYFGL